jgi:hypothetical protein
MSQPSILDRLVSGLVALGLVLSTGPAAGSVRAQANASPDTTITTSTSVPANLTFDGVLITASSVDSFANDPVIAFGPALDADGHTVAGEMWLIVAKDQKTVLYHLSEEPASGKGSYAGYTLKLKAVTTTDVVNYGAGEDVPVIGNDEDAFVVSTTELYAHSDLVGATAMLCSMPSGTCEPSISMVLQGTVVQVAGIPSSQSGAREAALQVFDASGSLLEELSAMAIASSSSGTCRSFADGLVEDIQSFQDSMLGFGQSGMWALSALGGAVAGGLAGASAGAGGAAGGAAAGAVAGGEYSDNIVVPATNALHNGAQAVQGALYGGLAKGACKLGELGLDLIDVLDEIEIGEIGDCGGYSVCDSWGTEQVGSVATYGTSTDSEGNEIEEVTVTPVDGEVCTSSHVEFACATI